MVTSERNESPNGKSTVIPRANTRVKYNYVYISNYSIIVLQYMLKKKENVFRTSRGRKRTQDVLSRALQLGMILIVRTQAHATKELGKKKKKMFFRTRKTLVFCPSLVRTACTYLGYLVGGDPSSFFKSTYTAFLCD